MTTYAKHLGPTPQSEPLMGQVANSAGAYSFPVDDWVRFERFLVLGSEGGSYYASERTLTLDNIGIVQRCAHLDGERTVRTIVEISDAGRAPKNDPALLALAYCAKKGNERTRAQALAALPKVARIGTHLFHFAEYVKQLGGWGRGTTRAFANWYLEKHTDKLINQAIKYQQRDGWSHRDILRKAHPKTQDETTNTVLNWMVKGWPDVGETPHPNKYLRRIWAFERAKKADTRELLKLIRDYELPHECVPNEAKVHPEVWNAMLDSMGIEAMVRNLGKMTQVGLVGPLNAATKIIVGRLRDEELLKKARMHPLKLLVAQRVYAAGHGVKGSLAWNPVPAVVDALDEAFYLAFKTVEPTDKRYFLALDVSGSMTSSIANMPITCREGTAAMALVTASVEQQHHIVGFSAPTSAMGRYIGGQWGGGSSGLSPVAITPRQRLDDAIKAIEKIPMGGTDCSLPMMHALEHKIPVDVFVVYTDSETWHGAIHPSKALEKYRQKMGIGAKLVVVGMVSNGFTIADPKDAGMLDVVGFDTVTPSVISDFSR